MQRLLVVNNVSENLSVRSLRVSPRKVLGLLDSRKIEPIGCPETSVANYKSLPRNIPEEGRSHFNTRFKASITNTHSTLSVRPLLNMRDQDAHSSKFHLVENG
jgi:hypothetical protein